MTSYLIYDYENKDFIKNITCGDRRSADKWCQLLEKIRDKELGTYAPIKFVDGKQVGII